MTTRRNELENLDVLLVDDDPDTRDVLSEFLAECGANVITASSAATALEALDSKLPRIIVSDIGMPEMDGYEFIKAIRNRAPDKGGNTVAIALTAYVTQEDRRRALDAGFQMHVCKPIELPKLASLLATISQKPISVVAHFEESEQAPPFGLSQTPDEPGDERDVN